MEPSQAIARLDQRIRRLLIDYRRFFSGDLALPPDQQAIEIRRELRRLQAADLKRAVDRFRLTNLEARFNSYGELFQRRLTEQEQGVQRQARRQQEIAMAAERGVVVDQDTDPDAVETLFSAWCQRSDRAPTMDLDGFASYLRRQVAALAEKTGCRQVHFRLVADEGRLKLKARPLSGG